jgi:hypothetical protein
MQVNNEEYFDPIPRLSSCMFYPGKNLDIDFCKWLAYGVCFITSKQCPIVKRYSQTSIQQIDDLMLLILGPIVKQLIKKIKG